MKVARVVTVVMLAVLTACSTALAAKGPQGVAYTPHNLSTSSGMTQYKAEQETEICIFCHTPHGGNLDGPLWNKVLDDTIASGGLSDVNLKAAAYFTHYNSTTLSPFLFNEDANRDLGAESLLCMSCHDGTIAANRVVNVSNTTAKDANFPDQLIWASNGGTMDLQTGWNSNGEAVPMAAIGFSMETLKWGDFTGGHLQDDHPVSFDYDLAQTSKGAAHLRDISVVRSRGVRFFPEGPAGTRLECSSCHDPHVNYGKWNGNPGYGDTAYTQYAPFLITTNKGSALCLACHIK